MSLMVRIYLWASMCSLTDYNEAVAGPPVFSFRILTYAHLYCRLPVISAQDDWDTAWPSSGAGGKAPPPRQPKAGYREHPYGRY